MVCRTLTLDLSNPEATYGLGQQMGRHCPANTILLLSGNLGSGKTTLVQGLGSGLGITDTIVSPTFTLINEYAGGRLPLYHIDLYRLSPAEAAQLNLDMYWDDWENTPGVVAIEWSERLQPEPPGATSVQVSSPPAGGRRAILTAQTDAQIEFLERATRHALLVDEV